MKPTHMKSLATNVLMFDLTFDPPSGLNDGSLVLVSCLSSGYKFASAIQCVGPVTIIIIITSYIYDIIKYINRCKQNSTLGFIYALAQ